MGLADWRGWIAGSSRPVVIADGQSDACQDQDQAHKSRQTESFPEDQSGGEGVEEENQPDLRRVAGDQGLSADDVEPQAVGSHKKNHPEPELRIGERLEQSRQRTVLEGWISSENGAEHDHGQRGGSRADQNQKKVTEGHLKFSCDTEQAAA
jgi:hypothetical protein